MSDSQVPAYVDSRKIFLQQGVITGTIALQRLERFRSALASNEGSVYVELEFFNDEFGRQIIAGSLRAEVQVVCQRCLEPLGIVLEDDIKLALLRDESKVALLDAELDPWICADPNLDLASLVEEQLILCLPIVSLHESASCIGNLDYATAADSVERSSANGTENPFAVLKVLKDNGSTN